MCICDLRNRKISKWFIAYIVYVFILLILFSCNTAKQVSTKETIKNELNFDTLLSL